MSLSESESKRARRNLFTITPLLRLASHLTLPHPLMNPPELVQAVRGQLFRLLDLKLVALHPRVEPLQLLLQLLPPLLILVSLASEVLELPLILSELPRGLVVPLLLTLQLTLQVTYPLFELGHHSFATACRLSLRVD